jgi:solute:Na+ symporter, SSS family
MTAGQLARPDLIAIGFYTVAIVWIGIVVGRGNRTPEDYFLAGRSLTWPVIGFSLFASNVSSSTLVGLSGSAYQSGIAVYNYEWMAAVVLVFFVFFLLPFYVRSRVFTMPEFLERRFDARSRYYFSAWTIALNVFIDAAGALYAGGLVVQVLAPSVTLAEAVAVLAVLAGVYTVAGGLRAVVYTDVIQAVLLLVGSTTVAAIAFAQVGSWSAVKQATPPEMLSIIQPLDDPNMPWLGLLIGVPLLGLYFWGTNQFMVQRVLGAKTLDHGRWGSLFAALLKLPIIFIMIMPGLFARVLYPDLAAADMVFPTMLFDLLPAGLRGLVMAALVAAIMSSLDSTVNSASTLVTMDFATKLRPQASERSLLWAGRVTTVVFMAAAALVAPQIAKFSSLWEYLQSLLAYVSPSFLACFVVGVFWRYGTGTGALAAAVGGHLLAAVLFVLIKVLGVLDLHFLYVCPIIFVGSSVILMVVSSFTRAPDQATVKSLVWTIDALRRDAEAMRAVPWYRDYRYLSLGLLLLTAACLAPFI